MIAAPGRFLTRVGIPTDVKVGIVVFPGSNCDRDVHHVLMDTGMTPSYIWHEDPVPDDTGALVLPGGFSYGDRLRAGAIASHSPVMGEVRRMAGEGRPILGICNGFQVLAEAGMLPGVLLENDASRFTCRWTTLVAADGCRRTPFTRRITPGDTIHVPVANGEGRYYADDRTISEMENKGQVLFRYGEDINGSAGNIAGVCNEAGNVVGMMPHPERAAEPETNPFDHRPARSIFESLLEA